MNHIKHTLDTIRLLESGIPLYELSVDDVKSTSGNTAIIGSATAAIGNKISSPMMAMIGDGAAKFFSKIFSFIRAGELGKDAFTDYQNGEYKSAIIHALTAIGYVIPQTAAIAGLYDLFSLLYENREEVMQAITRFFNNKQDAPEQSPEYNSQEYNADIAAVQSELNNMGADIEVDGIYTEDLYNLMVQYELIGQE